MQDSSANADIPRSGDFICPWSEANPRRVLNLCRPRNPIERPTNSLRDRSHHRFVLHGDP